MRSGAVSDEQRAGQGNARKQYALRFQEKGGKSREISVRRDLEMFIHAYLDAAGIGAENKDRPFFRSTQGKTKRLTGNPLTTERREPHGQAAAQGCRAAIAAVAALVPGDGDYPIC